MHFGSLSDLIRKKGENLNSKFRLKFAKEIAKGMFVFYSSIGPFILYLILQFLGPTYMTKN